MLKYDLTLKQLKTKIFLSCFLVAKRLRMILDLPDIASGRSKQIVKSKRATTRYVIAQSNYVARPGHDPGTS